MITTEEKHRRVGDDSFLADQLAAMWRDQGFSVYVDHQEGLEREGGLEREHGMSEPGVGGDGSRVGLDPEGVLEVFDVSRGDVYDANGLSQESNYLAKGSVYSAQEGVYSAQEGVYSGNAQGGVYTGSLLEGSQRSLNTLASIRGSVGDGRGFGSVSHVGSQQGGHLLGVRLEGFSQGSLEGAGLDGFTESDVISRGGMQGGSQRGNQGGNGLLSRGGSRGGINTLGGESASLHSGDAVDVALYPPGSAFHRNSGEGNNPTGGGGTPVKGSGGVKGIRPKRPPKTCGPLVLAQGQGLEPGPAPGQGLALTLAQEPRPGPTLPPRFTRHEALARSRVCVCLISRQAINSDGGAAMSTTAPPGPYAPSYSLFSIDSPCDELLLEHRLVCPYTHSIPLPLQHSHTSLHYVTLLHHLLYLSSLVLIISFYRS